VSQLRDNAFREDTSMRFMLVATAPKSASGAPSNPKVLAAIGKLSEELSHAGVLIETGGLGSSEKGARLRLSGGRETVTDGPFTEAKELAGGYAIVQVNSKEEAIELGQRFLQVHAAILGPTYEAESEVRELVGPRDAGRGNTQVVGQEYTEDKRHATDN